VESHLFRYEVIDVGRDTTGDFYGMLHYVRRVIQAITFKQLICEVESRRRILIGGKLRNTRLGTIQSRSRLFMKPFGAQNREILRAQSADEKVWPGTLTLRFVALMAER